jgi:hypothetical protein
MNRFKDETLFVFRVWGHFYLEEGGNRLFEIREPIIKLHNVTSQNSGTFARTAEQWNILCKALNLKHLSERNDSN